MEQTQRMWIETRKARDALTKLSLQLSKAEVAGELDRTSALLIATAADSVGHHASNVQAEADAIYQAKQSRS